MFSALYRNNPRLSPVEKLYHLLKKTQNEARDIVKSCPLTNAGFEMAWKNLVERYENKEVLLNAQLKLLFSLTPIQKESGNSINTLQRTINDCITNLSMLDIETDKWDVIFVYLCSTCLPDVTLDLWKQHHRSTNGLPTWKQMNEFLTSRYQTLESFADIRSSKPHNTTVKNNSPQKPHTSRDVKKFNTYHTNVAPNKSVNKPTKCCLCSDFHSLQKCPTFLKMSVEDRSSIVRNQKRCFNCLACSHDYKKCLSKFVCLYCKQKHHTLLHRTLNTSKNNQPQDSGQNTQDKTNPPTLTNHIDTPSTSTAAAAQNRQTFSTRLQSTQAKFILLGTASVDVCVGDVRLRVRALIDPASEASFVSSSLKRRLSLPSRFSETQVTGLNEAITATSSQVCSLLISSPIDKNFSIKVNAFVVRKLTGELPYHSILSTVRNKFNGLQLADTGLQKSSPVDLLLGGDIYPQVLKEGVKWENDHNLVAQKTVFGWVVTGQIGSSTPCRTVSSFYNEVDLNLQLTRFWELEEVQEASRMSDEDRYCEKLYERTTYRNKEGRFVVSLPFKKEFPVEQNLGNSRDTAIAQYLRNEARLVKQSSTKNDYDKVISEYLTLHHMVKVHPDLSANPNTSYYLPHHAVIKPDSTTTKLRVVFNASNPSSSGVSLNDILYAGPVLQADLTILILRWRLFRYVFNADIEKMYRQILIDKTQTPFQRIIFRQSPDDQLSDFEMLTVTFGVNCAPYLAIRTLLELAKQCETDFPMVSDILRNYMYVDDVLFGSHDLSTALQARKDLTQVLNTAGFSLRKWTANHKRLLQDLPPKYLLDSNFLKLSDSCTSKTLGLRWNAGNDCFYFKPFQFSTENIFTKRVVLSQIAKLFDPAGWLAPKIIVAKIIMQQIWKDNTAWDEEIAPSTLTQWQAFLDDYSNLEHIQIPRYIDFDPSFSIELHGFCDASEVAYAATLYLRAESPKGQVYTHLLAAKTKVAPVKFVTLPRKELCGAELMARMFKSIRSQLDIGSNRVYMWTDSTIVLSWLQKPPSHWKTFVANRVSSIIDKVGKDVWFHVDSKNNPADLASRGITARDLIQNSLWWHGPSWLQMQHSTWPSSIPDLETQEEMKPIKVHANLVTTCDILNRFSDLSRAMRVLCYVFRFFHKISPSHNYHYESKDLLQSEMKHVKQRLVIMCQKLHFPEYEVLARGLSVSRKSNLLALNPFIDLEGTMRVNGRLSQSPTLTYDERFPKILPYNGKFTRLYLELIHKSSMHGENSVLLRLMRIEYWVPKLKNLTKLIVHNCKDCILQRHIRSKQIMGMLPPERTTLSRPFTNTGVDFAGPFDLKSYVGRGCKVTKSYVLVFVCFSTKAIHLELTSEISTPAFMAAFSRFFSRRGCPHVMFSDNGTAFVGAANILARDRDNFLSLVRQGLLSQFAFQSIDWRFIPPGAPHMGGLWEAGVKSFKTHLKKVTHAQTFTYEEFSTMLIRIEACLNSRPLSPMTENPSDINALTPGHFLIGAPLLAPAEPDSSQQSLSYINRWQKLKVLHHHFALRWKEEYLKELHKRIKWQYPQRDFAVNDLVVVRRDNLPPNQWRLGRIEKVICGPDSKVRVCEVRTSNGLVTRPIVKLVLLPPFEQP
ncbi:uncharacterized protein LOC119610239 [Lucilia sericata]|uniref:uncharacterized protein LOC119610239 n=1 Tax=Lucilia sericata TaxID=13632 RepID=UPI0018A7F7D0|nr:uncharacterized protein LOC119610239 [Lucilia sericata]